MSSPRSQLPPPRFARALQELDQMQWRPGLTVDKIGAPHRIAPFSAAISAEFSEGGNALASGRLVLLHEPQGNDAWGGTFRIVSYARAQVDMEMVVDPLLPEVAWSWLTDALQSHDAYHLATAGTVTASYGKAFGEMEGTDDRGDVEIRSSWTALLEDQPLLPHLMAWQDLLGHVAGSPALPAGVVAFPGRP